MYMYHIFSQSKINKKKKNYNEKDVNWDEWILKELK